MSGWMDGDVRVWMIERVFAYIAILSNKKLETDWRGCNAGEECMNVNPSGRMDIYEDKSRILCRGLSAGTSKDEQLIDSGEEGRV